MQTVKMQEANAQEPDLRHTQTPPSCKISFWWIHCVCSLKLTLVASPHSRPSHLVGHPNPTAKPLCSCAFWNILCFCTLSGHRHTLPLLPFSWPWCSTPPGLGGLGWDLLVFWPCGVVLSKSLCSLHTGKGVNGPPVPARPLNCF